VSLSGISHALRAGGVMGRYGSKPPTSPPPQRPRKLASARTASGHEHQGDDVKPATPGEATRPRWSSERVPTAKLALAGDQYCVNPLWASEMKTIRAPLPTVRCLTLEKGSGVERECMDAVRIVIPHDVDP
jgi:hypothetical protein